MTRQERPSEKETIFSGRGEKRMKKKATDDLRQELMEVCDLGQYLKTNEEFFETTDFSVLIDQIFGRKGISKAKLAKRAGVVTAETI